MWVNHRYVGRTPVEGLEFSQYGSYEIVLRREGFRPKRAVEEVTAPWYERLGVDLFAEVLVPARLTDHRSFEYRLEPVRLRPPEEVLAEAKAALAEMKRLSGEESSVGEKEPESSQGTNDSGVTKEAPPAGPPPLPEEAAGPPKPIAGVPVPPTQRRDEP